MRAITAATARHPGFGFHTVPDLPVGHLTDHTAAAVYVAGGLRPDAYCDELLAGISELDTADADADVIPLHSPGRRRGRRRSG